MMGAEVTMDEFEELFKAKCRRQFRKDPDLMDQADGEMRVQLQRVTLPHSRPGQLFDLTTISVTKSGSMANACYHRGYDRNLSHF
jgi:hypothetical protein